MPNLLESLLETPLERGDKRRMTVTKRPFPERTRNLFEVFGVMGRTASVEGLLRGIEFRLADAHMVSCAILGRWPTWQELADLPDPYRGKTHLRRLVLGQEFRRGVAARMLMAFPEKRRLLFVRLPRCAGERILETMHTYHPVLPLGLDGDDYQDHNILMPTIGACANLFESTRTLAVSLPSMAPFVSSSKQESALNWDGAQPPCRVGDLLFAVIRPPVDLALSQVNAVLHSLQADGPAVLPAPLRDRIGPPPAGKNLSAWRNFGRALLPEIVATNPLCHALGDGTAEGALQACACVPLQLVALSRVDEWARVGLGPMDPSRRIYPAPILGADDLNAPDRDIVDSRTAEDRVVYARFDAKLTAGVLPWVAGKAL